VRSGSEIEPAEWPAGTRSVADVDDDGIPSLDKLAEGRRLETSPRRGCGAGSTGRCSTTGA
jgi:hypothetical protein